MANARGAACRLLDRASLLGRTLAGLYLHTLCDVLGDSPTRPGAGNRRWLPRRRHRCEARCLCRMVRRTAASEGGLQDAPIGPSSFARLECAAWSPRPISPHCRLLSLVLVSPSFSLLPMMKKALLLVSALLFIVTTSVQSSHTLPASDGRPPLHRRAGR